MIRSRLAPSASLSVKPNMRSAAGFQRVIAPLASEITTASPMAAISCGRSMTVVCMAVQSSSKNCARVGAVGLAAGQRAAGGSISDDLAGVHRGDLFLAVAQLGQHLVGVLAQQ